MYKLQRLIFLPTASASLQLPSKFTKSQNYCPMYNLSSAAKLSSQSNTIANTQRYTSYTAASI